MLWYAAIDILDLTLLFGIAPVESIRCTLLCLLWDVGPIMCMDPSQKCSMVKEIGARHRSEALLEGVQNVTG